MLGTVRTSRCNASEKRLDDRSRNRERERFDELAFVPDEDSAMMRRECGHDVLTFQFAADEILGPVELDVSLGVDFTNPGDRPSGDRQGQMPVGADIFFETKLLGQMTEKRPEPIPKDSWISSSMLGQGERPARLLEVIVPKESIAASANGSEVGTAMTKNANLPDVVEALHGRVSAGLFLRDESEMDSEKKMEPEDLGKAVTVSSPARGGHLVVHLRDPGKPHNLPGIKKMEDEGDCLFIAKLMGRDRLAGDVDGMDGIEPGKSLGTADVARSDQVGLLKIAHRPSSDVRIGRPLRSFTDFDLSGPSGSGQYLFDGRDGRERLQASFKELVMDRFGSDPSKGRSPGLMSRQFIADREDFADNRIARPVRDVDRGPTLIEEPLLSEFPVAAQPFREPGIAPLDSPLDDIKADSIFMKANRLDSEGMFAAVSHPLRLLPNGMGRSLRDNQNASRCPYGFSHHDVLTEVP
jgi:hypothetical protein